MKFRPAFFAALALGVVIAGAVSAEAQEPPPDDGSETTTSITLPDPTTSTTVEETSTTSTRRADDNDTGGASTTSTTAGSSTTVSPDDPGALDDGVAETVPDVSITVPPPTLPVSGLPAPPYQPSRVVVRALPEAQALAEATQEEAEAARDRVLELRRKLKALRHRVDRLELASKAAVRRLQKAQQTLNKRVAWAYMRGPLGDLSGVLESENPAEASTRLVMAKNVLIADQDALEEYQDARRAVDRDIADLSDRVVDTRRDIRKARAEAKAAKMRAAEAQTELLIFASGSDIVIHGFVFPVADPHNFVDTFGAPRMMGTVYQHWHEGTDIFAPSGTALLASERGVVARMGTDVLGGIKLWLVGESGVYYYYAHLLAYAPGLHEGQVVEPGTPVGFVGNTGNAATTPSHLHFEIHPGGGLAVNPDPLLKFADDQEQAEEEQASA
jgi:murein DD-endopeptidase MepM/ murein hydrolase activator NlpD